MIGYGDIVLFTQLQITQLKQQCPALLTMTGLFARDVLNVLKMNVLLLIISFNKLSSIQKKQNAHPSCSLSSYFI